MRLMHFSLLILTLIVFPLYGADPEVRSCWVTRYEWPSSSESTCKNTIRNIMQKLKDNNFNTVLFQVRGECDTLYPNPYEPWAPQFSWSDPGWDSLSFAIQEAHARGIEFHAYINTHTMCTEVPPESTSPKHVYHLHGKSGSSPNWQIHGTDQEPAGKLDAYWWLSPGIPQVEAWTRKAIMHVVENYDVDGIHFDRIRTPGSQFSHDPIAQARFEGEGNPDNEEWGDWMRSQITRQLRKIYGAVNHVKPQVKISAAPFGICKKEPDGYQGSGTQSYYSWYQDAFGWMENHVLDAIFPMIYWEIGSAHPFEVLLGDFLKHTGGRHIYAGCSTSNNVIAQIKEGRKQGAPGNTLFSYGSINFSALKSDPYSEPASIPEMPWKKSPTTGIITGYVKDETDVPIVDVLINLSGDDYNYLSSADGFYAILDVPPGTHTLTANKQKFDEAQKEATLEAGDVIRIDLIFSLSRGIISLDKSLYHIGEYVEVLLRDTDLAGEPSASVGMASDTESDPETLVLQAEGNEGRFTGKILIQRGSIAKDGILQVSPNDTITGAYKDPDSGVSTVTANVDPHEIIFDEPLDSDPKWKTEGGWDFGTPTGQGGNMGYFDPTSGYTGSYVYGYNLNGAYPNDLNFSLYLTSDAIDCSSGESTLVTFYRWLNVEGNMYDHATFEISTDGATWHTIWENPSGNMEDSSWNLQEFDISQYADYHPELYLRWGMGPTDIVNNSSGWNIDDIRVLQIPGGPTEFIIDNDEAGFTFTGDWKTSTQGQPYGANKRWNYPGDGSEQSSWNFNGIPAGEYKVDFWVNNNDYAEDAHYHIYHDTAPSGGEMVIGDQNWIGDGWHGLGSYFFTSGSAQITLNDYWENDGIYVVADAMKLSLIAKKEVYHIWCLY